jgi:hypothetical protein
MANNIAVRHCRLPAFASRVAIGAGIVCLAAFGASSAPRSSQDIATQNGRMVAVGASPLVKDVIPRWCYNSDPEYIFLHGRAFFKGTLTGELTKLAEFDRPGDSLSLRCSVDGRTKFFLSAQRERAYVFEDEAFGEYELSPQAATKSLRYGSLMLDG